MMGLVLWLVIDTVLVLGHGWAWATNYLGSGAWWALPFAIWLLNLVIDVVRLRERMSERVSQP
jgi:hypothetical protein